MPNDITFSFGQNWSHFIENLPDGAVEAAQKDIEAWLSSEDIEGKKVLDIGSGSGLHSLCFHRLGAASVTSFDIDPHSVAATTKLRKEAGEPDNWRVFEQSVLDQAGLENLGTFDLVYSWGVLHHTGSMWQAIENAATLVAPGGLFWIALYAAGPNYPTDLRLKQRYNRSGAFGKSLMEQQWILREKFAKLMRLQNPFPSTITTERGMSPLHDIRDWLGGLPYEVAGVEETAAFLAKQNFGLEKVLRSFEGGNHIFLFKKGKQTGQIDNPFAKKPRKTLVFGASLGGKNSAIYLAKNGFQVIGFCDNDSRKHGTKLINLQIHAPDKIPQLDFDTIHIGSGYRTEIWQQLVAMGIDSNRIQTLPNAILSGQSKPLAQALVTLFFAIVLFGIISLLF